ncbi:MAG: DEDD exonuclease domain-containing protein, partial [Natronosporangium sp.]
AGAGYAEPGVHPRPVLEMVQSAAETAVPQLTTTAEETDRVLAWLERPETRLVELSAPWSSPVSAAARFTDLLNQLERARRPD